MRDTPEQQRLNAEDLVAVHQAHDEWEGTILVGYLQDNGLTATMVVPPSLPPLDAVEHLSQTDKSYSILVIAHDAPRARQLLAEFIAATPVENPPDETDLQH